MDGKVLLVDDEAGILAALERAFSLGGISTQSARDPVEALELVRTREVAVVVSDNRMPGMSGIELLSSIKHISPDTVRILMTGAGDLNTAVDAINNGGVFKLILKPWDEESLLRDVTEALETHRVIGAMRSADEKALLTISQAIELKDPYTGGHCLRVGHYALMLSVELGFSGDALTEIERGSWLHDCGKIGVPDWILRLDRELTPEEYEIIKKHPGWGLELARKAMLSDTVEKIIFYHHERFDGGGYPAGLSGKNIPLEARIVSVADVYDALTTDRPYRRRYGPREAESIMLSLSGDHLDPQLVNLFLQALRKGNMVA